MQNLISFLHADGLITRTEAHAIAKAARELNENPVRILRSLNIASPLDIQKCFKIYLNFPIVTDVLVESLTGEYASLIPIDLAAHYSVFAFGEDGDRLFVAMEDPTDRATLSALEFFLEREIVPSAVNVYQLSRALQKLYGVDEEFSRLETVLDQARGAGAWSEKERELFRKIMEERSAREAERKRAVTYIPVEGGGEPEFRDEPTKGERSDTSGGLSSSERADPEDVALSNESQMPDHDGIPARASAPAAVEAEVPSQGQDEWPEGSAEEVSELDAFDLSEIEDVDIEDIDFDDESPDLDQALLATHGVLPEEPLPDADSVSETGGGNKPSSFPTDLELQAIAKRSQLKILMVKDLEAALAAINTICAASGLKITAGTDGFEFHLHGQVVDDLQKLDKLKTMLSEPLKKLERFKDA